MPDEKNSVPTPSAAPVKKSNAATVIIIVVVALIVLGIGGTLISRWLARRAASGILSAATGSNVSVNSDGSTTVTNGSGTTAIGGSAQWPTTMPSSVPKYAKGTITMSNATNDSASNIKGWSVVISNTNQSDYDAYKASLLAAGWTNTSTTTSSGEIAVYENGTYDMNLVFESSSGGVSIGVTPKSQ